MASVSNARRQRWWTLPTSLNHAELSKAFKNRSKTLVKKASELQTLCDVGVCLVCIGSSGEVETWPEDRDQAARAILEFRKQQQQQHSSAKDETILDLLRKKKRMLEEKKLKEQKGKLGALFDAESRRIDGLASPSEAPALMGLLQTLRYCLTMVEQEMEKKGREEIGRAAAAPAANLEGQQEVIGVQDWSVDESAAMRDGAGGTEDDQLSAQEMQEFDQFLEPEDDAVDQSSAQEIQDWIQQLLETEDPTIFSY